MNVCLDCKKKYHCCINPKSKGYVMVNIDEAMRLKQITGLDYDDFLTFSKLPKKLVTDSKNDIISTEARFRSDMMIDGKILRLKTKNNDECIFLENGKCSVYDIRPTICQLYPYWFEEVKGKVELIIHQGCEYCKLIDEDHEHTKLTVKQKNDLIKTAKRVIKQKNHYKKYIKEFVTKELIDN